MAKTDSDDDLEAGDEDSLDLDLPTDPKPRTSYLTILLCFLNVAAAAAFAILLMMNYEKRQAWSYFIFLHDLKIVGLPLREEEEDGTSASRVLFPTQRLEPARLKEVYNKRGGKSVSEPFQEVEVTFQFKIKPSHLTPEVLKDHFAKVGDSEKPAEDRAELDKARIPVVTLEDEIERLIKNVPEEIAKAAKEFAAAEKDKRGKLSDLLLPLTVNKKQIENLAKKIQDTPDDKLDDLLVEAAQRRMYMDILAPMEIFRPIPDPEPKKDDKNANKEEIDKNNVDNIADLDQVKLGDIQDLFKRRMEAGGLADKHDPKLHLGEHFAGMKRDTIEKREAIAFLLTTIFHMRKPNDQLLYKFGPDRVMALVGVYEYTGAFQTFTKTHYPIRDRIVEAIHADRDGRQYEINGKPLAMHGFQQQYRDQVRQIQDLMEDIWKEEKRLKADQGIVMGLEKVIETREEQVKKSAEDYFKQRKTTADLTVKLRRLQQQLFDAQNRLSTAIADNESLLEAIRRREGFYDNLVPKKK